MPAKAEGHKGSDGIRGKREFSEFKECSEVRDKCLSFPKIG